MIENVEKFMGRYNDPSDGLKKKVDEAIAQYPGSLEIRESVCENVLLPIAEEEGLPFTLTELRKYETRVKMRTCRDEEIDPDEPDEEIVYWLLDHGWEDDVDKFKKET